MSGSSAVEIDFFRVSDEISSRKLSDRRDIQGVMSKINPELLKTVIASASANNSFVANKPVSYTPQLPVYNTNCGGVNLATSVAPITIFYNGTVSVFDVSPHLAENIMKIAASTNIDSKTVVEPPAIGEVLSQDLPLSRKKSLRRFLEKRKERYLSMTPYEYSHGNASSQ